MDNFYNFDKIFNYDGKYEFVQSQNGYGKKVALISLLEKIVKNGNNVHLSIINDKGTIFQVHNRMSILFLKELDFHNISCYEYGYLESSLIMNIFV